MLVLALVSVYLACGTVLLAVLLQDRSKGVRPRGAGVRDPHATQTPELGFRTQY